MSSNPEPYHPLEPLSGHVCEHPCEPGHDPPQTWCDELDVEIRTLRAENEQMRAALLHVMKAAGGIDYQSECPDCIAACDLAFGRDKVG